MLRERNAYRAAWPSGKVVIDITVTGDLRCSDVAGDYFCAVAGVGAGAGVCGAADWVNRFLMALALKPSPMIAIDAGMISSFVSCSRAPDNSPARATAKAMAKAEDFCPEERPLGGRIAFDPNGLLERRYRDFPRLVDLLAADGGVEVEVSLDGWSRKPEGTTVMWSVCKLIRTCGGRRGSSLGRRCLLKFGRRGRAVLVAGEVVADLPSVFVEVVGEGPMAHQALQCGGVVESRIFELMLKKTGWMGRAF